MTIPMEMPPYLVFSSSLRIGQPFPTNSSWSFFPLSSPRQHHHPQCPISWWVYCKEQRLNPQFWGHHCHTPISSPYTGSGPSSEPPVLVFPTPVIPEGSPWTRSISLVRHAHSQPPPPPRTVELGVRGLEGDLCQQAHQVARTHPAIWRLSSELRPLGITFTMCGKGISKGPQKKN